MAFVEWDNRYSVNNSAMDEHHRRLFDIVNAVHEAVWAKHDRTKLGDIVQTLRQHSEAHFSAEEEAMRRHDYPGHDDHCREHRLLLEGLAGLERRLKAEDRAVGLDMLHFLLRDWLVIHILTHDKQYAPYLRSAAG
jgi:hemerythrin-like metal-binding domain